MTLEFDEMYQALLDKDLSYEGLFVAAIKTTGIFCRSSCRARKPLKENVEFFGSSREALQQGECDSRVWQWRVNRPCRPNARQDRGIGRE